MHLSNRQTLAVGFGIILLLLVIWNPIVLFYFLFGCVPGLIVLAILYYAFKGFTNR